MASSSTILIGTFTGGPGGGMLVPSKSEGLYRVSFDAERGELSGLELAAKVRISPDWICRHPRLPVLYVNSETFDEEESTCQAYRLVEDGALEPLTSLRTGGSSAATCAVHPSGRFLAIAHHGGVTAAGGFAAGGVAVLEVDGATGDLVRRVALVRHEPPTEAERRPGRTDWTPHAHSATWAPGGRFLLVCEKGLDKVMVYAFDSEGGQLATHSESPVTVGGGARHLAFHPDGRHCYVNEESGARVTLLAWDGQSGVAKPLQTLSTLPATFSFPAGSTGAVYTSECALGPGAQRLYVANRVHPPPPPGSSCEESIATFAVGEGGQLELVGHTMVRQHPRHFRIDPSGRWMLVGALVGDRVDVYELDGAGVPQPTGRSLDVPSPAHVMWLEQGPSGCDYSGAGA